MPVKERAIKSDLRRLDKLRDEDIDYSGIPELDDEIFAAARTRSVFGDRLVSPGGSQVVSDERGDR